MSFVEMVTPILTVLQTEEVFAGDKRQFLFGVKAAFTEKDNSAMRARLWHVGRKLLPPKSTITPHHFNPIYRDDITDLPCAWFIAKERPQMVDSLLAAIPASVVLTNQSKIRIYMHVHSVASERLEFVPRAVQLLSLEAKSEFEFPFERVDGGYVYTGSQ